MKKAIKNYGIQFFKEIIPVVAGILIALFIDNWNAERKDKAYIEQVFATIHSELKETNEAISSNVPALGEVANYGTDYFLSKIKFLAKCKRVFTTKFAILPNACYLLAFLVNFQTLS